MTETLTISCLVTTRKNTCNQMGNVMLKRDSWVMPDSTAQHFNASNSTAARTARLATPVRDGQLAGVLRTTRGELAFALLQRHLLQGI